MSDLRGESARDTAYRKLRRLLTCSGLQTGTRFGEVEWAERLGVHRGAIREAMAILLHEGLLAREGRSFVVPAIGPTDIREIYEVRTALEISALKLAAERDCVESETIDQLSSLCGAMGQLLKSDLYFGYSEADAKFHTLLVQLSGNQRLVHVYRSAPLPHAKFGGLLPDDAAQVLRRAQEEHESMCRCVSEGRILDAIPVLERHLSVDWWGSDGSGIFSGVASENREGEVAANL